MNDPCMIVLEYDQIIPVNYMQTNEYRDYYTEVFQLVVTISAVIPAALFLLCCTPLSVSMYIDRGELFIGLTACLYFAMALNYLLVVVGVYQSWRSRKKINLLRLHVILMLCVDIILIALRIDAELDRIRAPSPLNSPFSIWYLVFFLFIFCILNLPLILIAGSGWWFPSLKPYPPTDGLGKYLKCITCGYDLRGTPGPTCPECGASVLAEVR